MQAAPLCWRYTGDREGRYVVTITLDVSGGNSTVITVPSNDAMIETKNRGAVRADAIQVGDVLPSFEGACCSVAVSAVEVV